MILDIVKVPNEILKLHAQPVDKFNSELEELIVNMIETMNANDGRGLSAPQVNVSKQVLVFNEYKTESEEGYEFVSKTAHALINPRITWESKYKLREAWEGCLSIPDVEYKITRPVKIKVASFIRTNDDFVLGELEVDGMTARTIQHELDHLNGILISNKSYQMRAKNG